MFFETRFDFFILYQSNQKYKKYFFSTLQEYVFILRRVKNKNRQASKNHDFLNHSAIILNYFYIIYVCEIIDFAIFSV